MRRWPPALGMLGCLLLGAGSANGIITWTGYQASQNTTVAGLTPDELAATDGFGQVRGFLATAIGPNHLLTADHVNVIAGETVTFASGPNQGAYSVTQVFLDPQGNDLRVLAIAETLSSWIDLYPASDEEGLIVTAFGRGAPAGAPVTVAGQLKGWKWGSGSSSPWSWGRNLVARTTTTAITGPALVANFDRFLSAVPEEFHASGGE